MSAVMTASITELCGEDHGNDPAAIARWTANKTLAGVRKMLENPATTLFVAEVDGVVAAVGAVTGDEIGLNYVSPDHRFIGVSRALLEAMEAALKGRGLVEGRLSSTKTARRFYLAAGWVDDDVPGEMFGLQGFPMRKVLGR
jgi:GNAT superfamily N-acetyltransferase